MGDSESGRIGCTAHLNRQSIELVIVATGEHVNVAERAIKVIKDRARCILAELPWKMPVSWTKWQIVSIHSQGNNRYLSVK